MTSVRFTFVPLAAITVMLSAASGVDAQDAAQVASAHAQKAEGLTFQGEVALWTVAIKPEKTADFESVLVRVRAALQKSDKPERKQQAAGWRVIKLDNPLPDGTVAYVHIISPVVSGADYTILKAVYDELPNESQAIYALYRGAFAQNLAVASGSVVADMATPP